MELLNALKIFSIVLVICIGTPIVVIVIKYLYSNWQFNRVISKNDFENYIQKINTSIEKTKSDSEKNLLLLKKLSGMIYFKELTGIEDIINSINFDIKICEIRLFCYMILNLYIRENIEYGRCLASKIKYQNSKVTCKVGIRICSAINDYFNNDLIKSQKELQELSKIRIQDKYYKANVYFYLGLISKKENEIMKSKNYFNSAILCLKNKSFLVDRANKIINDISKE